MKRIFTFFSIAAAAVMTLVSCNQKELAQEVKASEVKFVFEAGEIATKTAIVDMGEGEYQPLWCNNDHIYTFFWTEENKLDYGMVMNAVASEDGLTATFTSSRQMDTDVENLRCCAFFPYNSGEKEDLDKGIIELEIRKQQRCIVSYDGSHYNLAAIGDLDRYSDLLVSKTFNVTVKDGVGTTDSPIQFTRISTPIKINLNCADDAAFKGEIVNSVKISTPGVNIAGIVLVDINTAEILEVKANPIQGSDTIELDVHNELSSVTVGGDKHAAFISAAPVTIPAGTEMTIEVVGETHTFKKVVTTPEMKLPVGNVAVFNVNLTADDIEGGDPQPVEHTISWTDAAEWDTDGANFSLSTQPYGYSVVLNKQNGSTAPTVNATANDCRLYAKGTATISNGKDITKIVFNISAQGLKRLAPITASVGTIAEQASGDETVVWTGKAKEVTFTVGDQANYGSDGSSKAGQLCFSSIDATYLDDGTADPEPSRYSVNIADGIEGGTVTASAQKAMEGATVTLIATPDAGYEFESWNVTGATVADATSATTTFTMPAADVNVSATFKVKEVGNSETYTFGSFTSAQDVTFTGTDVTIEFHKGTGSTNPQWAGEQARLYANGYVVVSSSTKNIVKVEYDYVINPNSKGNAPTVDGAEGTTDKGEWDADAKAWTGSDTEITLSTSGSAGNVGFTSITVYFDDTPIATKYNVTVADGISGGSVSANPTKAEAGATVTLTATLDPGYEFESWNVTGTTVADATSATTTFTMPAANVTVSATFKTAVVPDKTIAEFIAAEGVTCYLTGVVSDITNTTYGNYTLTDASGSIVIYGTLNQDGETKKFAELGVVAGDKIKVLASEYELFNKTTDEAKNVTFVEIVEAASRYTVSVASGISNGTVTVSPAQAAAGQTVTITATPASGYKVKSVSAKKTASGTALTVMDDNTFTMPAEAVTVSAEFELNAGGETTVSFDFSAQGYVNQYDMTTSSISVDSNISVSFDKGTNSNAPKYYTSGTAIRMYGANTMTVSASNSKTISEITITYGSSDGSNTITANVGDFDSPVWSGSSNSVVFTIGGTTGNRRIKAIEVVYK